MTDTITGTCTCGAPTKRERATGRFAEEFNRMPIICDGCADRLRAEAEREEQRDRERRHAERIERRIRVAGIPPALRSVDLDALAPTDGAADAIAAGRYWAGKGGGLLLTGPFGTGKTTIAAGALLLAAQRRDVRWLSAPLLMARLGSGLGTSQREQALDAITGREPLVLDDLDKTRPTEYGAEQIFLAVDGAVTSERALIVTTNLSLAQLAGKWPAPFGEAIASRLAGFCEVVRLGGADRRLNGRDA